MRSIVVAALAVAISGYGCTPATSNTQPGTGAHLSSAQERVAAEQQEREAAEHRAHFDPRATTRREICIQHGGGPASGDAFGDCWMSTLNPTSGQLDEAKEHERVAARRRAASKALENAEIRACAGLSAYDRDMSPFAHRDDILNVSLLPKGAVVVFKPVPTLTAEYLQKIVDCHIARNDALGHDVPEMSYCPLVPRDVSAKVTSTSDGFAVTVESTDPAAAREVRTRAQALH